MTVPMDGGPFENSGGYAPILLGVFPFVLLIWGNLGSVIADAAKE